MSGWQAILNNADTPVVVPVDDLRPHEIDGECWCKPYWDDNVLVHNSMDLREAFERGTRKPS